MATVLMFMKIYLVKVVGAQNCSALEGLCVYID